MHTAGVSVCGFHSTAPATAASELNTYLYN